MYLEQVRVMGRDFSTNAPNWAEVRPTSVCLTLETLKFKATAADETHNLEATRAALIKMKSSVPSLQEPQSCQKK